MKKNKYLYIAFAIILIATAYIYYSKSNSGSISKDLKSFAIEDTSSIDAITLSDRQGKIVRLVKKNKIWFANDTILARRDLVNNILEVVKRIEVKAPVNKAMKKNVMNQLATGGIQVEVFQDGDLERKFFVGGSTQDGLGTFMLLDNQDEPYITHIPGFNGYLTVRFITDLSKWKDKIIFRYLGDQISMLQIEYPNLPKESFTLRLEGIQYAGLSNFAGDTAKSNLNGDFLRAYIGNYANIQYENVADPNKIPLETLLIPENLLATITVYDKEGKANKVELFKRYYDGLNFLPRSAEYDFDRDRMFGRVNGKSVYNVQYFVFNKLIVTYKDFFSTPLK